MHRRGPVGRPRDDAVDAAQPLLRGLRPGPDLVRRRQGGRRLQRDRLRLRALLRDRGQQPRHPVLGLRRRHPGLLGVPPGGRRRRDHRQLRRGPRDPAVPPRRLPPGGLAVDHRRPAIRHRGARAVHPARRRQPARYGLRLGHRRVDAPRAFRRAGDVHGPGALHVPRGRGPPGFVPDPRREVPVVDALVRLDRKVAFRLEPRSEGVEADEGLHRPQAALRGQHRRGARSVPELGPEHRGRGGALADGKIERFLLSLRRSFADEAARRLEVPARYGVQGEVSAGRSRVRA
mmetsp:Transcript_23775/g.56228  ORF Transcript_23775/g.56228 Transcript_23775/m.56228 type:complete len:290 (+) Transcript_23775:316-1185(+)